jgi:hypothetical protein
MNLKADDKIISSLPRVSQETRDYLWRTVPENAKKSRYNFYQCFYQRYFVRKDLEYIREVQMLQRRLEGKKNKRYNEFLAELFGDNIPVDTKDEYIPKPKFDGKEEEELKPLSAIAQYAPEEEPEVEYEDVSNPGYLYKQSIPLEYR